MEQIVERFASEKGAQPLPVLSWNESMQVLFDYVRAKSINVLRLANNKGPMERSLRRGIPLAFEAAAATDHRLTNSMRTRQCIAIGCHSTDRTEFGSIPITFGLTVSTSERQFLVPVFPWK